MDNLICSRVRRARLLADLQSKDIAARLKISAPYFSQIEKGVRPLHPEMLIEIAKITGVSVDWLKTGIEPECSTEPSPLCVCEPQVPAYGGACHPAHTDRPQMAPDAALKIAELEGSLNAMERMLEKDRARIEELAVELAEARRELACANQKLAEFREARGAPPMASSAPDAVSAS